MTFVFLVVFGLFLTAVVGARSIVARAAFGILTSFVASHYNPYEPYHHTRTDNINHYILPIHSANILLIFELQPPLTQSHHRIGIVDILLCDEPDEC